MNVRGAILMAGVVLLWGCGGGSEEPLGALEQQQTIQDELAKVRAATARYHDVAVARANGYVQVSPCVESPAGFMGFHYLNFALLDGTIDALKPELLLYQPTDEGLKLVAVEYMLPIFQDGAPYNGEAPPRNPPPAPVLFGKAFDGPMPGHGPGEPWHYDLHVWIWSHNPSGLLATWNPALSCN